MDKFTEFVLKHEGDEVEALVLQKGRWPDIDVAKAANTIAGRKKMRSKAPSWWECAEVVYPSRLCVEQCSSEAASEIKAEILTAIQPDWTPERPRVADLTGGLGVDSWAFSKVAEKVLYVEKGSMLAETARHNFSVLGCNNIEVVNAEVGAEGLVANVEAAGSKGSVEVRGDRGDSGKKDVSGADGWEVLRKFKPDVIYLDPSRRGGAGEKVFKLEDCRPNILELRDKLLEIARHVAVKLSPMADIDEVVRQLGPCCRWVEVISVDNECKEVLVIMERGFAEECMIIAECGGVECFGFDRSEEAVAVPHYLSLTKSENSSETGTPTQKSKTHNPTDFSHLVGKILLEPDKALMKAAPFKLLSEMYGLVKLDVSTHYYIDDGVHRDEPADEADETCGDEHHEPLKFPFGLFRQFKILRVEPLNKRTLRAVSRDYPNAEVTARNIPLTTDELRRRLAVCNSKRGNHSIKNNNEPLDRPSDSIHIFALRAGGENLLLVTEKLY